jgi:hypothetical protein
MTGSPPQRIDRIKVCGAPWPKKEPGDLFSDIVAEPPDVLCSIATEYP